MKSKIIMHLSLKVAETKDAFSVQEIMEELDIPSEDILKVKNALESAVDTCHVMRKIARGKAWDRWKLKDE